MMCRREPNLLEFCNEAASVDSICCEFVELVAESSFMP